eukprot:197628_1
MDSTTTNSSSADATTTVAPVAPVATATNSAPADATVSPQPTHPQPTPTTETTDSIQIDKRCGVCLQAWVNTEAIIMLACNHYFHTDCIRTWVNSVNWDPEPGHPKTCPFCRKVVGRDIVSKVERLAKIQGIPEEDYRAMESTQFKVQFDEEYFTARSSVCRTVELNMSFCKGDSIHFELLMDAITDYLTQACPTEETLCDHHISVGYRKNQKGVSGVIILSKAAFFEKVKKPSFLQRNVMVVSLLDENGERCRSLRNQTCPIKYWANAESIKKSLESKKPVKEQDLDQVQKFKRLLKAHAKKAKKNKKKMKKKPKKKKKKKGPKNSIIFNGAQGGALSKKKKLRGPGITSLHGIAKLQQQTTLRRAVMRKRHRKNRMRNHNRKQKEEDEHQLNIDWSASDEDYEEEEDLQGMSSSTSDSSMSTSEDGSEDGSDED